MSQGYRPFPETHWSLVRRAGNRSGPEHREALTTLLNRYAPALRSYLLTARHMNPADADDLVQSFIADKILEGQLLRHAEQRRGRFRSFLLTCLNNFLRTRQRGKQLPTEPLTESTEYASTAEPASACLEAEWTRSLLHNVLEAMHEECERTQRQDVWAVFDKRILAVVLRSETPEPYERLAAGAATPSQVANLLVTAKRMYARLLRRAIAEYEATDEGIDQEIGDLHTLLSTAATSSAEHRGE